MIICRLNCRENERKRGSEEMAGPSGGADAPAAKKLATAGAYEDQVGDVTMEDAAASGGDNKAHSGEALATQIDQSGLAEGAADVREQAAAAADSELLESAADVAGD